MPIESNIHNSDENAPKYTKEQLEQFRSEDGFNAIHFVHFIKNANDIIIDDPTTQSGNSIHWIKKLLDIGVKISFSEELEDLYKVKIFGLVKPILDLKEVIQDTSFWRGDAEMDHTSYRLVKTNREDIPESLREVCDAVIYFLSQYYLLAKNYQYAREMFNWLGMDEERNMADSNIRELGNAAYGEGHPSGEVSKEDKDKFIKLIQEVENKMNQSPLSDFSLDQFIPSLLARIRSKLPNVD